MKHQKKQKIVKMTAKKTIPKVKTLQKLILSHLKKPKNQKKKQTSMIQKTKMKILTI